ncbi:MAG: hypothetical protein PHD56_07845 [Anaerostipes sp.]|nr:hypothetical protein [Anaerostipes sp.]
MSKEEKYKLALFTVIKNSQVMPEGIRQGKSMKEINKMSKDVMDYIMESIVFESAKESFDSIEKEN